MFRSLFLTLALLCPVAALARSFEVEGGTGIGFVDATLTIPLARRGPLDLEIGTYLFALDGKRPHETCAAVVWDDTWRLGAVRPAYDLVLPSVFARAAPHLAYDRAEYSRALATVEAMRRRALRAVVDAAPWPDGAGGVDA